MLCRLVKYEENYKFREYERGKKGKKLEKGLGVFVRDLKEEFRIIEYVYVWYVLMGYWGGIRFNVYNMLKLRVISFKLLKGL